MGPSSEGCALASVNEDLVTAFTDTREPVYRVYQPERTMVVLGAGGKPEHDLALGAVQTDRVPVVRRRGGGGTVVLSRGQLVVALVQEVDSPYHNRQYTQDINAQIAAVLCRLGVRHVVHEGISDLAINKRKILGSSVYRRRRLFFYQASLLVENDISLFSRYLLQPSRTPEYRAGRLHEEFCTTLRREGYSAILARLQDALDEQIRQGLHHPASGHRPTLS